MLKLVLLPVVIAGLIAVPCAFAHGKTSNQQRTHASTRHASHGHQGSKAADRTAQANQPESRSARQPDEEELEVDEVASQAK
jgi:hypothetical protein